MRHRSRPEARLNIRSLARWPLSLVVLFLFSASCCQAAKSPNILLILADDLGYSDLGCYGSEISTPNLDALAHKGLRFTQFYNTARCWPSRAAILTGYYAQQVRRDSVPGLKSGADGVRPSWAPLLPQILKEFDYRSYHSGKWHLDGTPLTSGFNHSYSLNDHDRHFAPRLHTEDDKALPPVVPGSSYYSTIAIADHAIKYLQEHAEKHASQPFFSYVAFTSPHFPVQAPPEDIARYKERYLRGWDAMRAERWERMRAMGIGGSALSPIEREVGPPYAFPEALKQLGPQEVNRPLTWTDLTPAQQEFQAGKMAVHAAMVDRMDREIGRILAQVRAMGASENTLVLFLSDNGASAEMMVRGDGHDPKAPTGSGATFLSIGPGWSSMANTPFRRHKTWVHEGGISTPFIVNWPKGIHANDTLRHTPGHVIDIVPTLLEVVWGSPVMLNSWQGGPVPLLPGRSLVPAFRRDRIIARDDIWWLHEGNRALRVGDWKIVASGAEAPWELYNLRTDRSESKNLAAAMPDRLREMAAHWSQLAEEHFALARKDPLSNEFQIPRTTFAPRVVKKRKPTARPNIIFILTDDQGYGDLSCNGNPILKTPNIDRLHDEGVRFTDFHVSPTCSPSRSALLTGRHEFNNGVTHTIYERERLTLSATTLAQVLKSAGYTTGIFGKWHLGDEPAYQPNQRGFDETFIHGGGGIGQTYPGSCGDAPGNTYFDSAILHNGRFEKTKGYCTDVFFDRALRWMDTQRGRKPFFAYIACNAPHEPLQVRPEDEARYSGKVSDPKVAKFYGMIANIDDNVGRLLAKLQAWDVERETLVIFMNDNGGTFGTQVFNAGMRGQKVTPFLGGTHASSFWHWPGTFKPADVSALTAHIDFFPTLAEIAGAKLNPKVKAQVEGRSLLPLLRDPSAPWAERTLFTHVGRWPQGAAPATMKYANCSVRTLGWHLVSASKGMEKNWMSFDLKADPGEQKDVSAAHPEIVAQMGDSFEKWWDSVQPMLVNEKAVGPAVNPFKALYWKQFGGAPPPDATKPTVLQRRSDL